MIVLNYGCCTAAHSGVITMDDCFNGYKVNLYDMFYGPYNIVIIPMAISIGIIYSLGM